MHIAYLRTQTGDGEKNTLVFKKVIPVATWCVEAGTWVDQLVGNYNNSVRRRKYYRVCCVGKELEFFEHVFWFWTIFF